MEFAVSDADGSRRWFEAVAEPLMSEDRTWGGVVAIRDVSERTMRLSLERLMAAAGHELKTPTAAIHNYLQLVERHLATGTGRRRRHTPRAGWSRAAPFDADRAPSRRVAGSRPGSWTLEFEATDLRAIIRSAVESLASCPRLRASRPRAVARRSSSGPTPPGSSRSC